MFEDGHSTEISAAVSIQAMAFRDDRSCVLVTITDLSFDDCEISSAATFTAGERIRLHLRGQGWFEAQVQSFSGDQARLVFLKTCKV
jgi:hypothetical protein